MSSSLDVRQIDLSELVENPFGRRFDFRIACTRAAHDACLEHVESSLEAEVCGVLVGDVYKDADGPYVEIVHAIRGEQASERATQVTFTHEAWAHISSVMDRDFPDKKIVGWYHSHPRFGIFLSGPDKFIHGSFFNQPWQIALVIDPHSHEEGFFVWRDGDAQPIDLYWIGDERRASSTKEDAEIEPEPAPTRPVKSGWALTLSSAAFFVLGLIFFVSGALRTGAAPAAIASSDKPARTTVTQTTPAAKIDLTTAAPVDVTQELETQGIWPAGAIFAKQAGSDLTISGKVYTYLQRDQIAASLAAAKKAALVDVRGLTVTHRYAVQAGDSLSAIAQRIYGSATEWVSIFDANRSQIRDPNEINVSAALRLPELLAREGADVYANHSPRP